ncbi:MAG: MCE family protein [Chitinispirillaceae bacterium]|nr:MCE family protein [Chitinispirillaceae bacterium]
MMIDRHSTQHISDSFVRRHRTFFAGLFVLLPLILIPGLLIYTLAKAEVFQGWCRLHVFYDRSYGLARGSQVAISGMSIGHVNRIGLVREGCVDVILKVNRRYRPFIKKDTRALLQQKNLVVGDWEIQLTGGTQGAPEVNDNDTLIAGYSLRADMLMEQVTGMVVQIDSIVRKIASGKGTLGRLLSEDSVISQTSAILQNVSGITEQSSNVMKQVDSMFKTVNAVGASSVTLVDSLKTVMSGVQKALADAQAVMANAKGASEHLGPMVNQIQVNLDQAEIMMRGLQKNWLIRKMTGKSDDRMLADEP